jgi:non-canonical (house-cleaning) NTP pyrophosphatase
MLIALGSRSEVKQLAVLRALRQFGIDARVVAVKAGSQVSEQPYGEETVTGARNRAIHTGLLVPEADLTIAIESGLFERPAGCFLDIAVVVVRLASGELITGESEGVVFPTDAVEEARRRGGEWTAGKVLQEQERVQLHTDPHASLVGRPRAEFIHDAVLRVLQGLRDRNVL